MRILYDHQVFSLQNAGGASRYHFELAAHLRQIPRTDIDVCLGFTHSAYPIESLRSPATRVQAWKTKLRPGLKRYALNELVTGTLTAFASKWDIYHPTLYRKMPFVKSRRVVVTHHDCIHERFPELFRDGTRVIKQKRHLYELADAIICVSESSRSDLLMYYNVDSAKVHVIHHGLTGLKVSTQESSATDERPHRPYLLYVGARPAYKNFAGLLHAYAEGGFARELDLAVAGGGEFSEAEKNEVARLGLVNQVIHHGLVRESLLARLYSNAQLFVYPSLYEGFGFPPLEAMSLGCPVLAAGTSSVPEICGDGALYFDPGSAGDLERKIRNALSSLDRNALIIRGRNRAALYDWQTTAAQTRAVYQRV